MIEEILEYNRKFVEEKGYEPYVTSKYPEDCNSELYGHPAYQSSSSSTGIKERRCKDDQECRGRDHTSLRKCGKESVGGNPGTWSGRSNGSRPYRLRRTGNES